MPPTRWPSPPRSATPADVTVVCVDVPGAEHGAILATADGGTVVFFSMATSFSAAALGAEGMAADVTMLVGNGYTPGHAALALDLYRSHAGRAGPHRPARDGMSLLRHRRHGRRPARPRRARRRRPDRLARRRRRRRRRPTGRSRGRGRCSRPAFVDAHVHATATGLALTGLDLHSSSSLADAVASIAGSHGARRRHRARHRLGRDRLARGRAA